MPRGMPAHGDPGGVRSLASVLDVAAEKGEHALVTNGLDCPRCDIPWIGDADSMWCWSCGWTQEKHSGEVLEYNGYMPKRSFIDCPYAGTAEEYSDVVLHKVVLSRGSGYTSTTHKCPVFVSNAHEGRCGRDLKRRTRYAKDGLVCSLKHRVKVSIENSVWVFMGEKFP